MRPLIFLLPVVLLAKTQLQPTAQILENPQD